MSDLISRQDAIDAMCELMHHWFGSDPKDEIREIKRELEKLPSADRPTVDCTKFMEWLKAEVLDEENWELNAIANGEVICRKFKKLGWLDVEDGFYVDARPTGKWIDKGDYAECSNCGAHSGTQFDGVEPVPRKTKFCPNCGAIMDGESK